ncbi:MAG: hypothetical protein HYS07_08240 [Chlamydiae bacterium]|nr:hypothetical protein [Chlamydiota bacterium]MBI3276775.1 hypothetical protein [Chlamydiota bacterium]
MEEMEQSMKMIEQALDLIPAGPILVNEEGKPIRPEDGKPILAANMVDSAKMGKIEEIVGKPVELDPTLQGSTAGFHDKVNVANKKVVLPPKEATYGNIEGLMNHFKLVMFGHGIRPPKGEVYFPVEAANGELGFYIVSDGTERPFRVRVRPPCFPITAALPLMLEGDMVADIVPTFGSVNMIAGELDR